MPHCATGCQMDLLVKDNRIVGAEPADGPSNHNLLCVKGKFGSYKFVGSGDRLTHPLIRRNGQLEQASWDEALDYMAEQFREIQKSTAMTLSPVSPVQEHPTRTISCSRK